MIDKEPASKTTKERKKLPFHRKVLFSAICLLIVVSFCELAVRVRAHIRYGGSGGGGVVEPLLVLSDELGIRIPRANHRRQGKLVDLSVNSLGFRGEEFEKAKPDSTFRIACIGASTTFCAEASNDAATWPARLQQLLNSRCETPVEVINAGIPGARLEQSLINLEKRVIPLQPDLIIVYHANNDMAQDTRELAIAEGIFDAEDNGPGWVQLLSRYSLLVELVEKNLRIATKGGNQPILSSIPGDLTSDFSRNLRKIVDVATEADCAVVLSTFLTKYRPTQSLETQTKNADVAFYYMPWLNTKQLTSTMNRYNQAIIDVAAATGTPIVDGVDSIPADEEHFSDCMHFRDAGCEKMAVRFADFLSTNHLLP